MALPEYIHEAIERHAYTPRIERELPCRKHGEQVAITKVSCDPRVLKVCIHCGLEVI